MTEQEVEDWKIEFDRRNGKVAPVPVQGLTGMSLRDWFAGRALMPLIGNMNLHKDIIAQLAYDVADAMIKRRDE